MNWVICSLPIGYMAANTLDGESATTTIGADIGGRGAEMVFGELR